MSGNEGPEGAGNGNVNGQKEHNGATHLHVSRSSAESHHGCWARMVAETPHHLPSRHIICPRAYLCGRFGVGSGELYSADFRRPVLPSVPRICRTAGRQAEAKAAEDASDPCMSAWQLISSLRHVMGQVGRMRPMVNGEIGHCSTVTGFSFPSQFARILPDALPEPIARGLPSGGLQIPEKFRPKTSSQDSL